MDSVLKQELESAGIHVEAVVERLMNSEELFLRVLKKFENDQSFLKLKEEVAAQNASGAFEVAHALKGVAGNLGMERLLSYLGPVVETLRAGSLEGIEENMEKLEENYDEILSILVKI